MPFNSSAIWGRAVPSIVASIEEIKAQRKRKAKATQNLHDLVFFVAAPLGSSTATSMGVDKGSLGL